MGATFREIAAIELAFDQGKSRLPPSLPGQAWNAVATTRAAVRDGPGMIRAVREPAEILPEILVGGPATP